MRLRPFKLDDLKTFEKGELVEVYRQPPEHGWFVAKIKSMKGSFYFVHYEGWDTVHDEIVHKNQIRLVTLRDGPDIKSVDKDKFKIPKELVQWSTSQDCADHLNTIRTNAKLLNISV